MHGMASVDCNDHVRMMHTCSIATRGTHTNRHVCDMLRTHVASRCITVDSRSLHALLDLVRAVQLLSNPFCPRSRAPSRPAEPGTVCGLSVYSAQKAQNGVLFGRKMGHLCIGQLTENRIAHDDVADTFLFFFKILESRSRSGGPSLKVWRFKLQLQRPQKVVTGGVAL